MTSRTTPASSGRARSLGAVAGVCIVVVAGVTACGGSSKSTSSPTAALSAPATTAVPTGSGSPTSPGTTAPTNSAATSVPTTAGGQGSPALCSGGAGKLTSALEASAKAFEGASGTSGLKSYAAAFQKESGALLAAAPAAIKPSLEDIVSFDDKVFGLLGKVGYDYAKLTPADLQTLESGSSRIAADSQKISAYLESACGVTLPTTASS